MKTRQMATAVLAASLMTASGPAPAAFGADGAMCEAKPEAANLTYTLKDADGKNVKLSGFKGRIIVLNFWATWCIPCRAEIPALVELQARYAASGLQVIGISVDDPAEKMKPFVAQYKMNYPVLTVYKNDAILDAYGPMVVVPATVIIQRDGTICARHIGPVTKENFEKAIRGLL